MSQTLSRPAQRTLVHRLIDWSMVGDLCSKYPAIGKAFPLKRLQEYKESDPYYCHYMAWRLGTWGDIAFFKRLDELLSGAEQMPNWKEEKNLLTSTDFSEFWSLLWQLQVAEYLRTIGEDVRWAKSGPDLSFIFKGERWYVECYTLRKSFGLLSFLDELLTLHDSSIELSYDFCLPLRLAQNKERSQFLNEVISPFLKPNYLDNAKSAAQKAYPVILYKHPSSSLQIYVEGPDTEAYKPLIVSNVVGNPYDYLSQIEREVVNSKRNSNSLKEHRPNILAANLLLSADFQIASSSNRIPKNLPTPPLSPNLDVVAISVLGINGILTKSTLRVMVTSDVHRDALSQIAEVTPR